MLQTYDPNKVNVAFNNRQLRMFGDSLFTLARDEANVSLKKGVKGDSTYVVNANKAGKLTITLQQESPDVAWLEQQAEKLTKGNLAITDANDSGTLFFAQNVMIEKLPDRARAKDAADVSIVFIIPDIHIS
ncbi:MAG: hypothetical protein IJ711_00210 [Lachnospiraceae bacterium]|nr:hypothetical protein [Clostridia bacterium]MBR1691178.1 hypothetical protein [Lachnospiraceae bacterium]